MNYPYIVDFEVKAPFRYLWLKYITGINLNLHCARTFKGQYSTRIDKDIREVKRIRLDEFDAPYIYLCGVAQPYNWENNFHLAMVPEVGSQIKFDRNGLSGRIIDAREIIITPIAAQNSGHPKVNDKAYITCRNWQFAHQIKKYFNE